MLKIILIKKFLVFIIFLFLFVLHVNCVTDEDEEIKNGDNSTEKGRGTNEMESLVGNYSREGRANHFLIRDEESLNALPTNRTNQQLSDEVEQMIREEIQDIKEIAMDTLLKIFGVSSLRSTDDAPVGSPPEFMIDLYNTITDSYGVTRARNPYNAHIVRSYMERNNSLNDYFYFNVSTDSLSPTESILEAELHVFRMPTPHDRLHPSLHLTPYCILSLYEVVDMKHLRIPDLHKLLGVNYVQALGSGWEVFNVKQSVTKWIKGERPNRGFLLVATSLGGNRVPVRFSRRGESVHSKQPNLVLFTEDSTLDPILPYNEKKGMKTMEKRIEGNGMGSSFKKNFTMIEKNEDEDLQPIPMSSLENPRFHHALLYKDSIRHPNSVSRFRSRRSKNQTETFSEALNRSFTSCGKKDLLVNFEAIGWSSWIISPKGYNAFYCDGPCRFPLGQQMKPTNHATVQSIVHELKLSASVERPCCVPTTLLPISLLYYDDHDNVVLRQYVDMVAESCGCH